MTIPDGWTLINERGGVLNRCFQFQNFHSAFSFMQHMAAFSEQVQHHPEWTNVYSRLDVRLTTHDVGGLTEKDFAWASEANQRYAQVVRASNLA
ncbi:MAG: putative pterin-4-alpha-carbinolamine dehydratase [Pseudomonadota bacterium]|jgi:4a-hydroxytetrahydrobiopterin dehydratase